ncbi:ABC transporter permease [Corallincola holothuriorum]|uniref:ABC transporter permease n=1 Tax=Corallincola holothuriorum TaxID=2282215 RepID=A0A368NM13_9GAMM|nr:ABC transporter permease [Corallincola holothuriorum]RCU50875.1 ABC transporter permease [Corallincola holothuriorum]
MRTQDMLRWLWRSLTAGRSRNLLSALGVAIGIAAVTTLTGIGEGVRLYLLDNFSQFGSHLVAVTPGKVTTQGISGGIISTVRPLTLEDADSLQRLPGVEQVVPVISGTAELKAGGLLRSSDLLGVNHQAADAWRFSVARGQFLPDDDSKRPRALAVLGSKLAAELFPFKDPLGEFVRVDNRRFRVIGVMAPKGQFLGFDLDDVIYLPAALALAIFDRESLMEIDVVYRPELTDQQINRRIFNHLYRRHGREDFTLYSQQDMLASLDKVLTIIKAAIGGLGGISLLVGAVGIFTIMSIAQQERIPEVGLLTALGANRYLILTLFLGEAVTLALAGGVAGLLIVVATQSLLALAVPGLPLVIQPLFLFAALLLSALVGLLAGLLPAWRAMRQDPVQALHGG